MHVRFYAQFSNESTNKASCIDTRVHVREWGSVRKRQAGITMLGLVVVVFFAVPIIYLQDMVISGALSPHNPRWDCYKFIL